MKMANIPIRPNSAGMSRRARITPMTKRINWPESRSAPLQITALTALCLIVLITGQEALDWTSGILLNKTAGSRIDWHEEHDCFPDAFAIMPHKQIVTIIDFQDPLRHAPEVPLVVVDAYRQGRSLSLDVCCRSLKGFI